MRITRFEEIEAWSMARRLCHQLQTHFSVGSFGRDFALRDQSQKFVVLRS